MANEPRLFEKNFINADCDIVSSHSQSLVPLVYDRDRSAQFISSGANSDAVPVVLTISFKEGSNQASRTLDTFGMFNHNVRDLLVEYDVAGVWTFWFEWTSLDTTPAGSSTDLFFYMADYALATPNTTKLRISMKTTQVADQEKRAGEFIVTQSLITPLLGMAQYDVRPRAKMRVLSLGDGSLVQVFQPWTANKTQKYEASIAFTQVSNSLYSQFVSLKESGRVFLWYPEPDDDKTGIYLVQWTSPLPKKYTTLVKSHGLDIRLDLKEQ